MGIIVVTHNGKLGGKRFGYIVGNNWIPIGTNQVIPLGVLKPKKQEPEVFWGQLRKTAWRNEECSYCGYSPNGKIMMNTADLGRMRVVKCIRCSMIMRPYNSLV